MKRPWYNFIYVRSPIAKILLGGAALLLTLALFGFTYVGLYWRIVRFKAPRWMHRPVSRPMPLRERDNRSA